MFVFLPKREADQIKNSLASYAAAEQTRIQRPTPQTDEGRAAERAIKTQMDSDEDRLDRTIRRRRRPRKGLPGWWKRGDHGVAPGRRGDRWPPVTNSLVSEIRSRRQPKLGKSHRQGARRCPGRAGGRGASRRPISNTVCKEVLAAISPSGTKGNELHKRFEAPLFGWPRDAVNGAILALLAAGNIRASPGSQRPELGLRSFRLTR